MPSSPQRQREQGSPSKHGGGPGPGYPAMYGGMSNHYGMPIKPDFDSSPQRYGGPHQGPHPFPPQGYHHLGQHGAVGQFGQYNPYYGAYGGPPNGYFPPHHGGDIGGRGGTGGHFPSPNRKHQSGHKVSPSRSKDNSASSPSSKEDPIRKGSSPQDAKSGGKDSMGQEKSSSSPKEDNHTYDEDELTSAVSPMRSDFHFFALDNKQEALDTLEKVKVSEKEDNKDKEKEDDEKASAFRIMTELNERLIKMWEDTSASVRTVYMQKEESDRYRFMSEDEIASRHCATLTSRTSARKNPSVTNVVTKDEEDDSQERVGSKRQTSESTIDNSGETSEYESPTKKIKEDQPTGPKGEDKMTEQGKGADGVPQNELKEEGEKKEDKPEEAPKEKGDEEMKSEVKGDEANS